MSAYLQKAVDLAERSARSGGGPFGALLVTSGGTVYAARNSVTEDDDPTAHAEVNVIRLAAKVEGFDLSGSVLYSSCSPCPMCLAAALWARVKRVEWAASSEQAAAAGFDDRTFHEQFRSGRITSTELRPEVLDAEEANRPFEAWLSNEDRTDY